MGDYRCLGQVYDMELSAIANGGQPMKKIEILDFKNLELTQLQTKCGVMHGI